MRPLRSLSERFEAAENISLLLILKKLRVEEKVDVE